MAGLALSEYLNELRNELLAAHDKGVDSKIALEVESAEIELELTVAESTEGKAEVKFYVLGFEASNNVREVGTQKVRLRMSPYSREKNKHGQEVLVPLRTSAVVEDTSGK